MDHNYLAGIRLKDTDGLERYLQKLPMLHALQEMKELCFSAPVTYFVGENGTGKSTLLEAIAIASGFNPEGGSRNIRFRTEDTHSSLFEKLILSRRRYPRDGFFLRAESFYNLASEIDRVGATEFYGEVSLHHQSHGESFFTLISEHFVGSGLYLLDEPEAALSPARQLAMLAQIHELVKADSQFIIATHSPILMTYPGAVIYEFTDQEIRQVTYEETEHFQLMKRFINAPELTLRYLLED